MRYYVTVGHRTFEVELGPDGTRVDGRPLDATLAHVEGTELRSLLVDGVSYRILAGAAHGDPRDLHLRGRRFAVEAVDERTRTIREMTGSAGGPSGPKPIRAPMPGLVVKVEVAEGDAVASGQGVVIVEAMKMENELTAQSDAVVRRILVAEGDAVEKDQVLVDLADPDAEEAS